MDEKISVCQPTGVIAFKFIEAVCIIIFTIEYLVRFTTVNGVRSELTEMDFDLDVLVRRSTVRNFTDQPVKLQKTASATFDFSAGRYWATHLHGSWAREAQVRSASKRSGRSGFCSARA